MARYNDGEYMALIWDGGGPDAYYIKGHVSHEDGIDILISEGVIDNAADVGRAVQKYGRWSLEGDATDGCNSFLREYKKPSRGRFKITEFGIGIFASKT